MDMEALFSAIPIWAIFIATVVLVVVSVEVGYRTARYRQKLFEKTEEQEKEAPVGAMVGATLGLLAFLLAFTFGMAADEFQARKMTVLEEANAIRTLYLRAAVVPEPQRTEIRRILVEYVDERLQWTGLKQGAQARPAPELLALLWDHAAAAAARDSSDVTALFLESANHVIDVHAERVMVRERGRIPFGLWAVLYALAVLSLAAMGYHGGVAGTRRSPVMLAVALSFSLVIVVIVDLNRPGEGWINVSQDAMLDLRAELGNTLARP